MAFWSDSLSSEPLRQHRWYIQFGGNELNKYRFALKSCTKPEYDIGVSEHVLLNHTFRYPKNLVWKPITVKMIAVSSGADQQKRFLTSQLYKMLSISGYTRPGFGETNIGKNKIIRSMTDTLIINIIQIDSNGNNIEAFSLYNPFINNIKFGSLSYDSENFVELDLSIVYDYAILFSSGDLDKDTPGVETNNSLTQIPDDSGLDIQNLVIPYLNIDTGLMDPRSVMQNEERKKQISPGFPNGNRR